MQKPYVTDAGAPFKRAENAIVSQKFWRGDILSAQNTFSRIAKQNVSSINPKPHFTERKQIINSQKCAFLFLLKIASASRNYLSRFGKIY